VSVQLRAAGILDASEGRRVAASLSVGLLVSVVLGFFAAWPIAATSGWDVAALCFLSTAWLQIGGMTPRDTQLHATGNDSSRIGAGVLLLAASVASLAGTAFDLVRASRESGLAKFLVTALAIVTVIASWSMVHTVFTLRYAHEYYRPPVGGIDFKSSDQPPDYRDFAYVAFTVGMTFQVSDTDVQDRIVRRTVLGHALLGYLFGAVIIAITINVVAQLLQ